MKPKILVDEAVLAKINEFYHVRLDDRYLGLECFSDPQLDAHICNPQAKLDNEQSCKYCGHVPERRCKVTCNIHYFCLAAYAYRLGVGDPSGRTQLKGALKHNLKEISYAKLYELVEGLSKETESEAAPSDEVQTELSLEEKSPSKARRRGKDGEPLFDSEGQQLLTIKAAAELYGCTYVTMHGYMRHGKIPRVEYEGKIFVKKADVEAYKVERGSGNV